MSTLVVEGMEKRLGELDRLHMESEEGRKKIKRK